MTFGLFLFSCFISFIIIFAAVRLAIKPLIIADEKDENTIDKSELYILRDISVLSNDELDEVIQIYYNKASEYEGYESYLKYSRVLNELKESKYLTEEAFNEKMEKLANHYNIK